MSDYLTYVTENSPKRAVAVQIAFEFFYLIRYLARYFAGQIIRPQDSHEGHKRPVVLVSGFFGAPLQLTALRAKFIENGHPVYALRLGFHVGNIHSMSQRLEKILEQKDIADCYIIGHSMGGLAALNMGYRGRDRTRKIFTVGTPHKGSFLAYLFPFTIASWQMMPTSGFIRDIQKKAKTFSNVQAIFARFDEVTILRGFSKPGRYDDVLLKEIGHLNLVMGPSGIECCTELVASEENKDPRPEPVKEVKSNVAVAANSEKKPVARQQVTGKSGSSSKVKSKKAVVAPKKNQKKR